MRTVFVGWDEKEIEAFDVAVSSLRSKSRENITVQRLAMRDLQIAGLYERPTISKNEKLVDLISDAPMSTGHAIARFFIPHMMNHRGWALFTDGDVLFRKDVSKLFKLADHKFAVMVVPHNYAPKNTVKKDGDVQTQYQRKNWSSVMLWNCGHPANKKLTLELLNTAPGRDLHRFCWLKDSEIGFLPDSWNWLAGHSTSEDPAIVHFTEGLPNVVGYENYPYAEEWKEAASCLAATI